MTGELDTLSIKAALARAAETGEEEWLPDGNKRGSGRLLFRAKPSGGWWYFRYTLPDGSRDTLAMGPYAPPGRTKDAETGRAFGLKDARDQALKWAELLASPETKNIRAHLEAKELAAARKVQADKDAAEAERLARESKTFTLEKLCVAYCDHLKARGKVSAKKVRADLQRHVFTSPIAKKTARDVTRAELAQLIRGLVEAGKPRTAGLIRAYLKAAFTLAEGAEGDTEAPGALIPFAIESNPAAGTKAIKVAKRSRNLSPAELRAFLRRLDLQPGIISDALWMCLLSGGQRPQQLLRVTTADYREETGELQLLDGKGRRDQARVHVLPLAGRGQELAVRLCARARSIQDEEKANEPALIFSSTGAVPIDIGTLSWRVTEISRAMVDAGEAGAPFQMKDLRRTVESMMSKIGIGKDLRAQLLSHGLSGVQSSTYDMHDYLDEKRRALELWERRLTEIESGTAAKVVPIRAA